MEYVRLCETTNDPGVLLPVDEDFYSKLDAEKPYFTSIFRYKQTHLNQFNKTGTISGIVDVATPTLYWDFDDKNNLEQARKDASELCARLISHGIPQDSIQIAFSGFKGFAVTVPTVHRFTPEEVKNITLSLAEGLKTCDKVIYNAARIFRVLCTKHEVSKLYKFPLSLDQLSNPATPFKELAKDLDNITASSEIKEIELPSAFLKLKNSRPESKVQPSPLSATIASELDFKMKPKGFSNCKFALLEGFFPEGMRALSLTALAATCRAQGFSAEITYNMLKGAARLQGRRTNTEPFSKKEIYNNIIGQVFGDNWRGGQYTCKTEPWLKDICDRLGENKCRHEEVSINFISAEEMAGHFDKFADHIEENTIKTGIKQLDESVRLTVGMPVALLGAPSSGKTSLLLQMLKNTSQDNIHSAFFSMDMYGPLVYQKKAQLITGINGEDLYDIWRNDPKRREQIKEAVNSSFKNVKFSTKSGHTVQQMRDIVSEQQDRTGEKIKLVGIDYLELISGPYSDATANTSKIASELKDFSTEMGLCTVVLVQPPKSAGDAREPLTSMRQIKGASMLEQSFRVILGIYREGFNPENTSNDKFLSIIGLKNTMGALFKLDNYWNGTKGEITELDDAGYEDLRYLRKQLEAQKSEQGRGDIF